MIGFDAPAATRAIWLGAFAPLLGTLAAVGVVSATSTPLAIAVMTIGGVAGGTCIAVSPRFSIAGMTAVLVLLVAQGLPLDPDQALLTAAITTAGVLLQSLFALATSVVSGRESEQPGVRERLRSGRAKWRANVVPGSYAFRHALRWGIALGAAVAVYKVGEFQGHGYWVPLTVLFVLKPEADDTWERMAMRAAGTVAGLLIATALAESLGELALPVAAALFLSAALCYALLTLEYALFTAAITVYIVLLTDTEGYNSFTVADERGLATAIGIAIAGVAAWIGASSAAAPRRPRG